MKLINGLLGNASKISAVNIKTEFAPILTPDEKVEHVYKLIRDYFVFTNKRLVLVNKQGLSGNKVEFVSIPYKHIIRFSVETAGSLDLDSELRIWLLGDNIPILVKFNKKLNIYQVQSVLANYVL